MNKYAGKHPKLVPNRNLGFMNKPVIEIGLDQSFGKSAIYNEGGSATPLMTVIIEGGNTLPAPFSTLGIRRVLAAPAIANGGYDLSTNPTLPNGLGYGRVLFGQAPGTRVYVGNFPPGSVPFDMMVGHIGCSYNSTTLISPDLLTSILVYFPIRLG